MKEKYTIKTCAKHGETIYILRIDKRYRCKKCAIEAVSKRRRILKLKAIEYKGGKCQQCNYNKSVNALEFHHLDPNQKDFGIGTSGATRAWDKIKIELDKCILVCANCHREIHAKEYE